MKTGLICFSDSGAALAQRLCETLTIARTDVHSIEKYAVKYGFTAHETIRADMGGLFSAYDALVFLCACGIAVREIAPYVKSKKSDPAVLVMDDGGRFVIPILSGHIGGANALARQIELLVGAKAVITTATDGAGRFSPDAWAAEHGCAISSMRLAKEVSAAVLTGNIPVVSEFPLPDRLPDGLTEQAEGDLGISIGVGTQTPFSSTLRLIPKIVTVGVGCRRGASEERISAALTETLKECQIDLRAVCRIASIDIKRDEPGLLACAHKLGVPAVFFSAEELGAVPGDFEESDFVKQTVGVGNVCERAAVCAGGKRLVRKTARNGVTVAVGIADWSVLF